jgi:hypothetical protein
MRSPDLAHAKINPTAHKRHIHRVLCLASLFLSVVGFIYLIHGSRLMFTFAGDYKMRWVEQHYVFQGKNPIDIFERGQAEAQNKPVPNRGRDSRIDPTLGPTYAGYPPWAYFTGAVLTWPSSFTTARCLNGIFNLFLLAGLILWAYRLGKREDRFLASFLAASLFAVNSICTTFILGQYGVLVLAALVAAYLFDEKNNWLASGLCLGIAMTKVTLAGPFVLPFLVRARWRVLLVAGSYLLLGSLVIWPIIKTNPIEMLGQMARSSERFEETGYSLNNLLEFFGLGVQPAMKLAALGSIILATGILYLWRSSSILTHYAIVALATRAWCYHVLYDNLILVFLLLALGLTTWRTQSRVALGSFIMVGITLWVPGRLIHVHSWMIVEWVAWIQGLAVLLFLKRNEIISLLFTRSGAFVSK